MGVRGAGTFLLRGDNVVGRDTAYAISRTGDRGRGLGRSRGPCLQIGRSGFGLTRKVRHGRGQEIYTPNKLHIERDTRCFLGQEIERGGGADIKEKGTLLGKKKPPT